MNAKTRHLVGRRIVAVEWNQKARDNGWDPRHKTTDPTLELDNGRRLWFSVDELDNGYGVRIGTGPIRRRRRPPRTLTVRQAEAIVKNAVAVTVTVARQIHGDKACQAARHVGERALRALRRAR